MTKTWIIFVVLTVASWGLYGVFLHNGQSFMLEKGVDPKLETDDDKAIRRYKSFLLVGLAYLLVAVIGSAVLLFISGAEWSFTSKGVSWSFLAGVVGAVGAFGVLLAFGAGGRPAVVMSIVFAGAPIVNAFVATLSHPPKGGWSEVRWEFLLGILLAAVGGCLVTFYKPSSG